MTTTTTINNKPVVWNLTETEVGPSLKADLISRGFDGTAWQGESIPTGKQAKRVGLFHRQQGGQFVPFLIMRG